ncbi:phosphoserine phosphatase SerB [Lysinibacter sp. HNR]|uniref:phosphoserine phosphatase SerB n=1 Tax=Lysinibacter sp. HNR TaxID=3031408 RepID=UPI002434D496|nr:phosphoserine phosphatase SerB [Lysinibacter sp. HNR]WGD36200.1 phosphoserine phosphatase SerB [Lysinibacter sp. HNR]
MTAPFLVVLDADSTTIRDEVIELLAEEAGSLEEVADITNRAMRGELDFTRSLTERVATLRGLPQDTFHRVYERIRISRGMRELVSFIHASGGVVAVVSGGFHELLDPLAVELSLDEWRANRLEVQNGLLTGNLIGPIIDAEAKARALREWAQKHRVTLSRTVAIGDGANDLAMMAVAGLAVAYNAKPIVQEKADVVIEALDLAGVIPHVECLLKQS